ncbi:uncharacterized protein EI90DRAFT_2924648 [Cantharellus anzutake]|uniref:uncharacterized protein n=1 Tax=Cantharellus anzutake TaxID=1750568 RepID=UPI0019086811|nr:uncharacterized protein EI90DRAFT_2924648 [Cantharellus anzutake]KAF8329098.1 hypothetical protein EI90DRAFT_2924648 [Cantharellus anzutake]
MALPHPSKDIFIAAVIASSLTTVAFFAYDTYKRSTTRRQALSRISPSVPRTPNNKTTNRSVGNPIAPQNDSREQKVTPQFDDDLIREFLARNYAFFGSQAMNKVRCASVVIVGCGGVGSWAALMLLRSGVSNIRLIDFDLVSLSSLNRHACAVLADVGIPKVTACKQFFSRVAPWANIDARIELWQDNTQGYELLQGADWVIDAIDNISTKVDLLTHCHRHCIPIFASMGAGAKSDPTRVQISDIAFTQQDPLARSVRRRLRLNGIDQGIPVVYSTEVPSQVKLLPLPEDEFQKGSVHELGALDNFRVRILPVIGPLPSIFGLHIASYIICQLAGKPIPHPLPSKNRWKLYASLTKDLAVREGRLEPDGLQRKLPIDERDVGYIFDDLHSSRSVVPPHSLLAKPVLTRWDVRQPLSLINCVVLSQDDLGRLDAKGGIGDEVEWWGGNEGDENAVIGQVVRAIVRRRQEEAREVLERL